MKTKIVVDIPNGYIPTLEDIKLLLEERDSLVEEIAEIEKRNERNEDRIVKLFEVNKNISQRCDDLEEYIVRIRGSLPSPSAFKAVQVAAISKMLPEIEAFAKSIQRGTGSAANYEYQFRHAEHRAKLIKENLRAGRKMMAAMIVTVGSIADRTANSINPEDIHHLREELDQLSGYQEVMAHIEVDSFLDGVIPELNLMEGTGRAGKLPAIRVEGKPDA